MTKEQLLEPRIIVEHIYPDCRFLVGERLERWGEQHTPIRDSSKFGYYGNNIPKYEIDAMIANGSNNFRYLGWSEFRKPIDMPKYIKNIRTQEIIKVSDWDILQVEINFTYKYFEPSSETEYEKFKNGYSQII